MGPSPSSLTQLLLSAERGEGVTHQGGGGPHLSQSQPLPFGPRAACWSSAHSAHHFCVTDSLYRQSAPEFRVASSVEQLNIMEVGAQVAEGQGLCC